MILTKNQIAGTILSFGMMQQGIASENTPENRSIPCPDPSAKVEIQGKTITVFYKVGSETDVKVCLNDANAQTLEVIENDKAAEGSYKITYKLVKPLKTGSYKVEVNFNGILACSKDLVIK